MINSIFIRLAEYLRLCVANQSLKIETLSEPLEPGQSVQRL